jgi:hypothetical protein
MTIAQPWLAPLLSVAPIAPPIVTQRPARAAPISAVRTAIGGPYRRRGNDIGEGRVRGVLVVK